MNVKRFTARTSREALTLVRQAFGEDAVILSTKPCAQGVEVMAMASESVDHLARLSAENEAQAATPPRARPAAPRAAAPTARAPARPSLSQRSAAQAAGAQAPVTASVADPVAADVGQLAMSTLSFQDYVRERMLKKREAALRDEALAQEQQAREARAARPVAPGPISARMMAAGLDDIPSHLLLGGEALASAPAASGQADAPAARVGVTPAAREAVSPAARGAVTPAPLSLADTPPVEELAPMQASGDMLSELRAMKGLIEERFGALAFMEKLQCHPAQARLSQKLLDAGFSPALIRKLTESLPAEVKDEAQWASSVLERNLNTAPDKAALEEQGGVLALVGSTGVGKTTTTAKLAAAFATRYGPGQLGLVTLDAYRMGAQEQLRAYGRILGVPVHTAHDRASLEDLLDLLSAKKMVLIDTAGMPQRDSRTREMLDMLGHRSIQKLLVLNAAAQGETLDDVIQAYRASTAKGVVLSKIDEAVKLGPALDAVIRHRLTIWGAANGQRVPEDWHRLSAQALIQRALRATSVNAAFRLDSRDVNLVFSSPVPHHGTDGLGAVV